MSVIAQLVGTFLMFIGFTGMLCGVFIHRLTQQDLGRMYMSTTFMGGGQMPSGAFFRFMASARGNDSFKKRKALQLITAGAIASIIGALIA